MNNRELAHEFAYASDIEIGKGSNMFFENGVIYSYGRHFPIAKYLGYIDGEKTYLFTKRDHSVTTAKHKSYTYQAICHFNIIYVYDVNDNYTDKQNLIDEIKAQEKWINELLKKAAKARKPEKYINEAANIANNIIRFANIFNGKKYITKLTKELSENIDLTEYLVGIKNKVIRYEKAQARKKANRIKDWIKGKSDLISNNVGVFLRINNGYVQTSRGAKVTINSAFLLWKLIEAKKDIKGYNIDGYTVISINGTLKIGCHEIPLTEVKRIGNELNKLELCK